MEGITLALAQVEEKLNELKQVKELLENADSISLLQLYGTCQEQGIKLSHYFSDNRELLRNIKEELNRITNENGFSFTMQEMHLNSDKLTVVHHVLGTVGELYLSKKRLFIWKNPFRHIISNQVQLETLQTQIPKDEERISRYENELARYQKMPEPFKKLRGFTPSKLEKMENIILNEKDNLERANETRNRLLENEKEAYQRFVETSFEFKRFLSIMNKHGFSSDFHAFDEKKTYFMYTRKDKYHSHSSILSYEEEHMSLLHNEEWSQDELKGSNLSSFRFTEEEFQYLLEAVRDVFPQVKREYIGSNDTLSIETENGEFYLCKDGFVIIHGEDLNLYHLLRFSSIRKALCLLYKERSHEDNLKAIQGM